LTKIGINVELCLGSNRDNFQLYRCITIIQLYRLINTSQKVLGATFVMHTVDILPDSTVVYPNSR